MNDTSYFEDPLLASPPDCPTSELHTAMISKEDGDGFSTDMMAEFIQGWQPVSCASPSDIYGFPGSPAASSAESASQPAVDPQHLHLTPLGASYADPSKLVVSDTYPLSWTYPVDTPYLAVSPSPFSASLSNDSFGVEDYYSEGFSVPSSSRSNTAQTPELEYSPRVLSTPLMQDQYLALDASSDEASTPLSSSSPSPSPNSAANPALRRTALQPMKGQRLKGDGDQVLKSHFKHDATLHRIVQYIYAADWFRQDDTEPKCSEVFTLLAINSKKEMKRLKVSAEDSIFAVFCDGGSKCLLPHDHHDTGYKMNARDRPQRRISHVRSHFDHRPYVCDGDCLSSKSSGSKCDLRFHGQEGLTGHKSRNGKKEPCGTCRAMILARNMKRHATTCRGFQ